MFRRIAVMAALAAAVGASPLAWAVGPSDEVVQERLYPLDGRVDLSVMLGTSLSGKLHDTYGGLFLPSYHFTDAWALEVAAGYFVGLEKRRLTNSADPASPGIRLNVAANGLNNEFADMSALTWVAMASLRWSPVYGKLSLAGEWDLQTGAYISVGGGAVGLRRESLVDCANVADTNGDGYVEYQCTVEEAPQGALSLAAGVRVYIADWFALRAEMREIIHPDSYRLNIGDPDEQRIAGFTANLMFMSGASFYF